jgi:hypothetical protein
MIAGHHEHTVPVAAAVRHEIAILRQVRATDVARESQNRGHRFEDGLEWSRAELKMEVGCVLYAECGCSEAVHFRFVSYRYYATLEYPSLF